MALWKKKICSVLQNSRLKFTCIGAGCLLTLVWSWCKPKLGIRQVTRNLSPSPVGVCRAWDPAHWSGESEVEVEREAQWLHYPLLPSLRYHHLHLLTQQIWLLSPGNSFSNSHRHLRDRGRIIFFQDGYRLCFYGEHGRIDVSFVVFVNLGIKNWVNNFIHAILTSFWGLFLFYLFMFSHWLIF